MAERWTAETERLVAQVWEDHDTETVTIHPAGVGAGVMYDWACSCGRRSEGGAHAEHIAAVEAGIRHTDRMLLTALAEAGLLVTSDILAVLDAAEEAKRLLVAAGISTLPGSDLVNLVMTTVADLDALAESHAKMAIQRNKAVDDVEAAYQRGLEDGGA